MVMCSECDVLFEREPWNFNLPMQHDSIIKYSKSAFAGCSLNPCAATRCDSSRHIRYAACIQQGVRLVTERNAQCDTSWCLLQVQIVMNTGDVTHQGVAIQRLLDSTNARLDHVKVAKWITVAFALQRVV